MGGCRSPVPAAASELFASKPAVEVTDLGEGCRVRVRGPRAEMVRDYADPARNCERRARFAAELIIVTLMPPHFAFEEATGDAGTAPEPSAPSGGPPTTLSHGTAADRACARDPFGARTYSTHIFAGESS